jgi:hypothetical protein
VPETNPINDDLSNRFVELNKIRAHELKGEDNRPKEIELKNRKRN